MSAYRLGLLGVALLACTAFSSDRLGRACVEKKGQLGVAYDIDKTKLSDAYSPNGRRLLQDGHRMYNVKVPALTKRDKPIECTMTADTDLWRLPTRNPFASDTDADDPNAPTSREKRARGFE